MPPHLDTSSLYFGIAPPAVPINPPSQVLSPDTDACVLPPAPAAFPVFFHPLLLLGPSHAPFSAPCVTLAPVSAFSPGCECSHVVRW